MAKPYKSKQGEWRFYYVDKDGKRKSFFLGKRHTFESAIVVQQLVESLVSSQIQGKQPIRSDLEQIKKYPESMRQYLVKQGIFLPNLLKVPFQPLVSCASRFCF